jgi:hypothetical protein
MTPAKNTEELAKLVISSKDLKLIWFPTVEFMLNSAQYF